METENPTTEILTDKKIGEGICGIVMPMSGSGDYSAEHWAQIRTIIEDAAEEAGFKARIVSTNTSQGIIQSNLVNNLDRDEIVICDLSNNNPNVMIELGMRIAFGKPFILIKDNVTNFSSDIGLIIHELYTKDMLYPEMKAFKNKLSVLIKAKAEEVKSPGYKSFISTFSVKEVDFDDIQSEKIGVKELLTELVNSINVLKGSRGIVKNEFHNPYEIYNPSPFTYAEKFIIIKGLKEHLDWWKAHYPERYLKGEFYGMNHAINKINEALRNEFPQDAHRYNYLSGEIDHNVITKYLAPLALGTPINCA
ncbi:hypothetical protein ACW9KT_15435 [Hymenobacter sp. HD11105]